MIEKMISKTAGYVKNVAIRDETMRMNTDRPQFDFFPYKNLIRASINQNASKKAPP